MKAFKFNRATKQQHKKSGFTIIEVVLVLAIAGLIFLMVFIALPALQRNQRDTQRKNDMVMLKDAIDRYKTNNRGKIPFPDSGGYFSETPFGINYLKADEAEFKDPDGSEYISSYVHIRKDGWVPSTGWQHSIWITSGMKCDGEAIVAAGGTTKYTIQYRLESGGIYCIDG